MTAKTLMIGLDAADRRLVETLMAEGRLPTLKRLSEQGARGSLLPLPGLGDDAVWTSFATGVGPGVHGRFYHMRFEQEQFVQHVREGVLRSPFWEELADRGLRVAVIDVPKSPLGRIGNGVAIADWMSHGPDYSRTVTRKPELRQQELEETFPQQAPFRCEGDESDENQFREFEQALLRRGQLRADALVASLETGDWDLFLAVFAETHCAGHSFWDRRPAIENVYTAVDGHLERVIEAAGPDAVVIVFSLIGMGPNNSGTHLATQLCSRFEGRTDASRIFHARLKEFLRTRKKAIPGFLRKVGASLERRLCPQFQVVPVDLPTTVIRHRRLTSGATDSQSEKNSLEFEHARQRACRELREEFLQLRDPDTKVGLVRDVIVCTETFEGPHAEDFADLIVIWDQTRPISSAHSPRFGTISAKPPTLRAGNHREGGWFFATRNGIGTESVEQSIAITEFSSFATRYLSDLAPVNSCRPQQGFPSQ